MANQVQVVFIGDPGPLFTTADQVEARLNKLNLDAESQVNKLRGSFTAAAPQVKNFGDVTEATMKRSISVTQTLTEKTDALTAAQKRGLDAIKRIQAEPPTIGTRERPDTRSTAPNIPAPTISDEQFRRGRQLADANAFAAQDKLERAAAFERSKEKLAIYRAEKAAEITLEEQTAGKIKQVRGFGAVFRAAGLQTIGITESEINAGITAYNKYIEKTAEAKAAANAEGAAAVASAGAIKTAFASIGSIGAAGIVTSLTAVAAGAAIVYHITSDIRKEEETKLRFIEAAAGAYNRQLIAGQNILANLKQQREEVEFTSKLRERLATNDIESIKRTRDNAQALFNITPPTAGRLDANGKPIANPELERLQKTILDANARLREVEQQRTDDQNKAFRERGESNIKSQKQSAEFEIEQAQKRIDNAKRLGEQYRSVFDDLTRRANAENPFVKIWSDSDKALAELRKNLAGISPELQAVALKLQQTISARELFGARTESALTVSDLRQQASFFRSGTKAEDDKAFEARTDAALKRLGFNPQDFRNLTTRQRANFAGQQNANRFFQQGDSFNGVDTNTLARGAFNLAQQRKGSEETIQERLDRQFKELSKLRPGDEVQRDILDRKIIALTAGVDPTTLRQDTRNRAADARERQAERVFQQEAEANELRKQEISIQTQLLDVYKQQLAGKTGTAGAGDNKLKVTIQNKTNGKATVDITAPTPADVETGYSGGLGGFVGGG
jgi:hypothetical protein